MRCVGAEPARGKWRLSDSAPTGRNRFRRWGIIAALAGLALSAGIIVTVGFDKVVAAFTEIGWRGLLALCATYMPPLAILATAWYVLDARARPKTWITFVFARMVRDASGELLPFSSLGGFVFGARAAILGKVEPVLAISTTALDVTAEFIGQLGFAALGLALLSYSPTAPPQDLFMSSILGLVAGAVAAGIFILLQHRASGPLEWAAARWAPSVLARTSAVTASVHALYRKPGRLILSAFLHLVAWVLGAVGVWAGLWIAGQHQLTIRTIVGVESLVYVVRTVTFAAPMGLGVIEGGYVIVGHLFGLPAELALAISLIKRLRDIVIGVPALALWQVLEGRRLLIAPAALAGAPANADQCGGEALSKPDQQSS